MCQREAAPFHSYVDAGCVQIDLDRDGHFIGLSVEAARETWPVEGDLWAPRVAIPATVRFQSRALTLGEVTLATDPDRLWLRIDLAPAGASHVIEPCENVAFEVSGERLTRIWILSIQEDYGCRQLRAWRGRQN